MPSSYDTLEFDALYDTSGANPSWGRMDLDGDGRLDLVITEATSSGIAGLGTTQWLVYAFPLPSGFATDEFDAITDTSGSNPTCALLDLAGDGRVDLVVSEWWSSGIAGLGTTSWLRYPNLCP